MLRKPAYGRIFFEADTGDTAGNTGTTDAAATTSTTATPPSTGESDAVTFSEAQQREINRLIGKARQEGRMAAEEAAQKLKQAEEEARQRDEEIKRGEFDKVRADLESKLATLESEKQGLADKVAKYEAIAQKQVDALKGELPAEAVEDFPTDADPVTQLEWLEARKALVAKLAPAAANGNGHPRPPATPKPQGAVKPDVRENLRSSGIRYQ